MTFLFYASAVFASRAKVLTDSIKIHHPTDQIVHINPGQAKLGQYIPGMAKERLEKTLELLESGHDQVVVLGADCELFGQMTELNQDYDMFVVPHMMSPHINRTNMANCYQTGHANADLMSFNNTDNSKRALKWLIKVTEGEDRAKGYFYEQTWLSAIPYLYDNVKVIRHPGYNYGYWALDEVDRKLAFAYGQWYVSGKPLIMAQYSGYIKGEFPKVSKYYYSRPTDEHVLKLFKEYDERI